MLTPCLFVCVCVCVCVHVYTCMHMHTCTKFVKSIHNILYSVDTIHVRSYIHILGIYLFM